MTPNQASCIAPRGTGFSSEARTIGCVADWKAVALQDLTAVQVDERNLRRPYEIEVVAFEEVGIFPELGQLSRADHDLGLYQIWRRYLRVAVLPDVHIEHEGPQRSGEGRAVSDERLEARARDLGAALEINDAEVLADLPVGSRREREVRPVPPVADLEVVLGVDPEGDTRVRDIGHLKERGLELRIDVACDRLELGDSCRDRPRLVDQLLPLARVR